MTKQPAEKKISSTVRIIDRVGCFFTRYFLNNHLTAPPKKILAVCLGSISKIVQTIPAIQLFKLKFPETRIDYLMNQCACSLFQQHPGIDTIIPFHSPGTPDPARGSIKLSLRDIFSISWEIRRNQYDAVINFQPDLKLNLLSFISRSYLRIGYGSCGGAFCLTHDIPSHTDLPEYQRHLNLLKAFSIQPKYIAPRIFPPQSDIATTRMIIEGLHPMKPIVAVHVGGNTPEYQWNPKKYRNVIREFQKDGKQILLLGGPGQTRLLNRITENLEPSDIQVWNFPNTGEIAALGKFIHYYLGTQSDTSHIIAAMGVPSIVLLPSEKDLIAAPLGKFVNCIFPDESCATCVEPEGESMEEAAPCNCMDYITEAQVLAAFQEMLSLRSEL